MFENFALRSSRCEGLKEAMMRGLDEPSLASAMRAQESYPVFAKMQTSNDRKEGQQLF